MIVSLRGKLIEAGVLRVVIESAGVGYEVNVPVTTAERLPRLGAEVFLLIHHVFREDGQALYGFAVAEEREFFKLLVEKVSGVGPKMALNILSRLSLPILRDAIIRGDVALLSQCPGIGKKTAERLVMELKDKVGLEAPGAVTLASAPWSPWASNRSTPTRESGRPSPSSVLAPPPTNWCGPPWVVKGRDSTTCCPRSNLW